MEPSIIGITEVEGELLLLVLVDMPSLVEEILLARLTKGFSIFDMVGASC